MGHHPWHMGLFSDLFTTPGGAFESALLDQIALGVSVYRLESPDDPESFRLIYSNPASGAITGLDVKEEVGRLLVDVAPAVREMGLLERYAEIVRTGKAADLGQIEYDADGRIERGVYQVNAVPLPDRSVGVVFEDVRHRQEVQALQTAREDVETQERRYRSLVEATAAIVWTTPPSGAFETDQPSWRAFTGQTDAELRGEGWLDAIHPGDREDTLRAWRQATDRREPYAVRHRLRHTDGTYRAMQVRAVPILRDGAIAEWVGVHTDIEEQEAAMAALAASEGRFRVLFDAISDVLLVYPVGPDGPEPFVEVNQAAVDLYGYDRETLRTLTLADLLAPGAADLADTLEELRRSRTATFTATHQTSDGRRVPMQTNARMAEYDGRLCVVSLSRDDTERAQFQRELSRSNITLERTVSERTAQLEAFAEDLKILHAITTAEHASPEARYNAYLRAGCEMFDLPIGILSATPIDPDTGEQMYRLEAVASPDPALVAGLTVPLSEAFCDAVVARESTVVYADASEEAPDHPACAGRGLRAFIGTPIVIDGELVGTLNFVSPEPRAEGFAPYERELIEVMADAVARRLKGDRAAASEAEARGWYQSIVETVDEGVIVVDADCEVILSNPSAKEFLGIDTEAAGDHESDDMPERWPTFGADGLALLAEDLPEREVLRTGQPVRGSLQGILRPDGTTRWYRVNATPVDRTGSGTVDHVVVSFSDVTEFREATREMDTMRGLLGSVLDASPDGVMAFRAVRDDDGAIEDFTWVLVNPRASEIVGRPPEALIGHRLLDVFPGNREAGLYDAYAAVVETGTRFETVIDYPHDGLETSFRVVATPIPTEDGFTVTFAEIIDADLVPGDE